MASQPGSSAEPPSLNCGQKNVDRIAGAVAAAVRTALSPPSNLTPTAIGTNIGPGQGQGKWGGGGGGSLPVVMYAFAKQLGRN